VKTFKGIIAPRLLIKQKWTTIMIMIKVAMKSYLHRQQCYCILNVEGPASMNTIKASKKDGKIWGQDHSDRFKSIVRGLLYGF
jgi:hypothetical protein